MPASSFHFDCGKAIPAGRAAPAPARPCVMGLGSSFCCTPTVRFPVSPWLSSDSLTGPGGSLFASPSSCRFSSGHPRRSPAALVLDARPLWAASRAAAGLAGLRVCVPSACRQSPPFGGCFATCRPGERRALRPPLGGDACLLGRGLWACRPRLRPRSRAAGGAEPRARPPQPPLVTAAPSAANRAQASARRGSPARGGAGRAAARPTFPRRGRALRAEAGSGRRLARAAR